MPVANSVERSRAVTPPEVRERALDGAHGDPRTAVQRILAAARHALATGSGGRMAMPLSALGGASGPDGCQAPATVTSIHVLGSHQLGGRTGFHPPGRGAAAPATASMVVIAPTARCASSCRPQIEQCICPLASKWDVYSRLAPDAVDPCAAADVVQTYPWAEVRDPADTCPRAAMRCTWRACGYYRIDGYYHRHAQAWVGNTQDICDHGLKACRASAAFHIGFVPQPRRVGPIATGAAAPEAAAIVRAHGGKEGFPGTCWRLLPGSDAQVDGRPLVLLLAGWRPSRRWCRRRRAWAWTVGCTGQAGRTTPHRSSRWATCSSARRATSPWATSFLSKPGTGLPVLSTANEARELVRDGENAAGAAQRPGGPGRGICSACCWSPAERQRLADADHATVQREHSEQGCGGSLYLAL